jgi:hypothetical protein
MLGYNIEFRKSPFIISCCVDITKDMILQNMDSFNRGYLGTKIRTIDVVSDASKLSKLQVDRAAENSFGRQFELVTYLTGNRA